METRKTDRRSFIRNTTIAAAAVSIAGTGALAAGTASAKNKFPRWKGFNLLDYFSPAAPKKDGQGRTTEEDFKWMSDWGFDFVRIPMAYPSYLSFDRSRDITKEEVYKFNEEVLDDIEKLVYTANKYKMHVSLNLHRGPGYCINAGFHEPYNLWKDKDAQDAFFYHWGMWSKRFKNVSPSLLSFDLLNEPAYIEDMNDQYAKKTAVPGQTYRLVVEGATKAIRAENPDRMVVADGNNVGNMVSPELIDLNVGQSCRGYWPGVISHYQAPWVWKDPSKAPTPVWPGTMDGKYYDRKGLEDLYKPWIELKDKGVGVHCGECGCWRATPHDVFIAWFTDVIDILTNAGIGYALWNFRGEFGILDSNRKDIQYADWHGHKLDKKLLDLLKKY